MATNRTLNVSVKPIVQSLYTIVDQPENPEGILDNLNYEDLFLDLVNGDSGNNQVDIQYHERRVNNTETETIDLSADLKNVWDDILNFAATKFILIFNRNASSGYLTIDTWRVYLEVPKKPCCVWTTAHLCIVNMKKKQMTALIAGKASIR